ncbi:MAG: DUF3108 domain-containing protein [Lutibacter sp.]|nr:DUF3108 domain-containing protein [Lutibacter sp.]MBP9600841.1 DUF3108 domain-containing protein [Lutibacter sp.]
MRKLNILIALLCITMAFGQSVKKVSAINNNAFKGGEWLKFRLSYSNFFNAGYSTIEVKDTQNNGQEAFHILGKGKSTGLVSLFFKVNDDYQTFMYKESLKPYRFIRKIDEGGYTKDQEIFFDHTAKTATVKNYKHKTTEKHPISSDIQDMLSALYFLRNQDLSKLKKGDAIELQMFMDDEIETFKLQFIEREIIKTKFGKVKAIALRPYVQAGRVFKERESLTVWVSDDENKIPLLIKASLAVGSLRADLDAYKGLANPFNIIFK